MKKKATFTETFVYKFYSLLGHICRILLNVFSSFPLKKTKPVSDLNLLLFSGKKGASMIKPVLLSIYNRWNTIPYITLVTDGTPKEEMARSLKFWPYPYQIKSWEETADFHKKKGRIHLAKYAEEDVYGRKLTSILAEGEVRPTLFCDTDVLWFSEPRLPELHDGVLAFRMSADDAPHYNMTLLNALNRHDILTKKPLNAGVIFVSGSVYDHAGIFEQIDKEILPAAKIEIFAEQTTLSILTQEFGDSWSLDEIFLSTEDKHWPFIPGYFFQRREPLFARHHVVTKNSWFWRDALYLFLFKRGVQNKQSPSQANPELQQNG